MSQQLCRGSRITGKPCTKAATRIDPDRDYYYCDEHGEQAEELLRDSLGKHQTALVENDPRTFGYILRQYREKQGWSLDQMLIWLAGKAKNGPILPYTAYAEFAGEPLPDTHYELRLWCKEYAVNATRIIDALHEMGYTLPQTPGIESSI